MEIEEMQTLWSEMSRQLEEQKKLTNEIIMNMTQERYSRKFQTIFTFEAIGALICFVLVFTVLPYFNKLDTWYFMLCGIYTVLVFTLVPVLVLRALNKLRRLNISEYNYKETLITFIKRKNNILQIQKIAALFYIPLMLTTPVTLVKIFKNLNFLAMEKSITLYIMIGIHFLFTAYIVYWGYNYYKRLTNSAEKVLNEIE